MGKYRWYLLNAVFWSYSYEFFITLWKPVFLGATFVGFSRSVVPLGHLTSWWVLQAVIACMVNMGLGIVKELFYRFSQ
ncbi:hypothetical protein AAVH_29926, partial [Aphelenchoides avenae]